MKAFFTTLLTLVWMGVLLWGNFYWTDRTTVSIKKSDKPVAVELKTEKNTSPSEDREFLEYTKNWPEQGIVGFKKAIEEKRPYRVLLIGSKALGDESGWAALTKEKLLEAYGEKQMNIEIKIFENTSQEFLRNEGAATITDSKADLVLFEPFTLMDNGEISIEDSLNNTQSVIEDTKEINSGTVFILMPPHPIYNATFYPKQVEALKDYAKDNNIAYLDHWAAWPDPKSEEIKEYITADNSQPNEQGHELWSKYVTDYLISK